MNPETNFPEPPPASPKRQVMLSLTAIAMGLVAAAFLLTRPQIPASTPVAGCGGCSASKASATEAASNTCEMRAIPSNATNENTNVKTSGVPHE